MAEFTETQDRAEREARSENMSLTIVMLNHTYFIDELRARGHRVILGLHASRHHLTLSRGEATPNADIAFEDTVSLQTLLRRITGAERIDRIILHDESRDLRIFDLEKAEVPTIFYSIDCHIHPWHPLVAALVDRAFFAQKDYAAAFGEWNPRSEWLPLWALDTPPETAEEERRIPVCFRGGLDPQARPKRVQFLSDVARRVPLDAKQGPWAEAYPFSKIVLNDNSAGDLNFRVFEALVSGALLITARIQNGLGEIFREGEHFIGYEEGNVDEAVAAIQYYLAHEEERKRIAQSARALVLERHTQRQRANAFIEAVEACERTPRTRSAAASAYLRIFNANLIHPRAITQAEQQILKAMDEILSVSAGPFPHETIHALTSLLLCLESSDGADVALGFLRRLHARAPGNEAVRWLLIERLWNANEGAEVAAMLRLPVDEVQTVLKPGLEIVRKLRSHPLPLVPLSSSFVQDLRQRLQQSDGLA